MQCVDTSLFRNWLSGEASGRVIRWCTSVFMKQLPKPEKNNAIETNTNSHYSNYSSATLQPV